MPGSRLSYTSLTTRFRQLLGNDHVVLSVLALAVGALVGISVVGFREAIDFFQGIFYGTEIFYGTDSEHLAPIAAELPAWRIVLATTLGGLIVGILAYRFMPERRPQGVADVIEANALLGVRMSSQIGVTAAGINALSIGCGGSVGREGPAVHLGAALSSWIGRRLHL